MILQQTPSSSTDSWPYININSWPFSTKGLPSSQIALSFMLIVSLSTNAVVSTHLLKLTTDVSVKTLPLDLEPSFQVKALSIAKMQRKTPLYGVLGLTSPTCGLKTLCSTCLSSQSALLPTFLPPLTKFKLCNCLQTRCYERINFFVNIMKNLLSGIGHYLIK